MAKHLGYHEHLSDLPIKRGDKVTIPKGTTVHSMGTPRVRVAARNYTVTVRSVSCGQNFPEGHPRHDPSYPTVNPRVVWVGSGYYWCEADINDVTKVGVPS